MDKRDFASIVAAVVLSTGLIGIATSAAAGPREATVIGKVDPSLQRTVSYADLNLAYRFDQKVLKTRIAKTADSLCLSINGFNDWDCSSFAVRSTDAQVARAIDRAEQRMAGLPVGPAVAISMSLSAQ